MKIRLFLQSFDFGFRISDLEFRVSYITLRIPNPKSNDAFFQKVKDIISPIGKPENHDHPLYFVRDGIVVIPKDAKIPSKTQVFVPPAAERHDSA